MPVFIDRIINDLRNRYNTAVTSINKEMVLLYTSLVLIFILAYLVRIFAVLHEPAYEIILTANDPYSQLRAAMYIEENGLAAFLSWVDPQTWYPEGRFWGKNQYIGTPLSAVLIHQLTSFLGLDISLMVICYYQPALMGALTCVAMYFLGKELGNKKIGILAALFLAISPGHLQRTVVGFFDHESLGILFLILTLYFYARSLRTGSLSSTMLAGICLGILSASWGAATYVFNLLALHAFVMLLLRKHSDRLFLSYGGSILLGFFIMILIPKNGAKSLLNTDSLSTLGVLGLVALAEIYRYVDSFYSTSKIRARFRTLIPFIAVAAIIGVIVLFTTGVLGNMASKFITVLLPIYRDTTPILKSVSEHQIVTWSTFFRNTGVLIFLLPLSIYFLYLKPTERNFLLLLFGFTAIYFAGSMVRLALILAPAVSLLAAQAIDQTLLPFVLAFQERFALSRRKTRFIQPLSNEQTAIAFVFIGIIAMFALVNASDQAAKSTQAPSISTPVYTGQQVILGYDWQEAISWLDYNTGPNDVVASWWDYGYWISGNSNTTILVDNATINKTKIGNIGCMLVLNPRDSLKISKIYDVTYLVLLVSDGWWQLDSDLGKVPWFIRIGMANGNIVKIDQDDYLKYDSRQQYIQGYIDQFYDSVFWSLFTGGGASDEEGVSSETFERIKSYAPITENAPATKGFSEEYAEYSQYYELAYRTAHKWIYIWRIRWDIIPPAAITP
ncbi:MAG: glycosyltransferase family 39 protein [Candidatus Heimdallarchaeota archaeon]|nr:MAG: glycosyltransferase family 39 protein [Candidatus Heimdallarchaeota archaeon]